MPGSLFCGKKSDPGNEDDRLRLQSARKVAQSDIRCVAGMEASVGLSDQKMPFISKFQKKEVGILEHKW